MSRRRFLAIIMSVFMILSLLPATVFAETSKALDGQLKIQGLAAAGTVLSADLKGIKTEGVTEDSVSYEWFRKTPEDEKKEQQGEKPELKQLGKEKTYTIVKDDVDSKIVLTITGLEDKGFSGSLTATTATVAETVEAAEQNQTKTELNTEDMGENESQDANASEETSEETLEIPEAKEEDEAGSESVDGIPAATEDTETSQPEQYEQNTEEEPSLNEYQEELYPEESNESSENVENTENAADNEQTSGDAGSSSVEGIPAATEDGTYGEGDSIPEDTDEKAYQAEAEVGDGSSDVLNFGNVVPGQEDDLAQYITIKNTGTETLNFVGISPEHFAVQDITEPLEAGQSVQVWIAPRVGTQPGTYEDTITYQTEEGAEASFQAQMTITEEAPEDTLTPEPTQIPEDTPTPEPTQVPEDTPTPEPTQVPEDTPTPEPTQVPLESKVRSDMVEADFGSVVEGYTEAPQAKTATLTNEGNADAVLSDVFSDQGEIRYFDVSLSSQQISANGGTAAFSVRPKNNLSAGTYTESFTITDTTSGQNIVLTASVTVDTAKHSLGISTDTLDFASAKKGYSGIGGQQVTVTNNGNVTETLIQPTAKYFTVTASSALTIQPGETAVFTVTPTSGLDVNSCLLYTSDAADEL